MRTTRRNLPYNYCNAYRSALFGVTTICDAYHTAQLGTPTNLMFTTRRNSAYTTISIPLGPTRRIYERDAYHLAQLGVILF